MAYTRILVSPGIPEGSKAKIRIKIEGKEFWYVGITKEEIKETVNTTYLGRE